MELERISSDKNSLSLSDLVAVFHKGYFKISTSLGWELYSYDCRHFPPEAMTVFLHVHFIRDFLQEIVAPRGHSGTCCPCDQRDSRTTEKKDQGNSQELKVLGHMYLRQLFYCVLVIAVDIKSFVSEGFLGVLILNILDLQETDFLKAYIFS